MVNIFLTPKRATGLKASSVWKLDPAAQPAALSMIRRIVLAGLGYQTWYP